MVRALFLLAGVLVIATGLTPFDLLNLHVSDSRDMELAICAILVAGGMITFQD